MTTATPPRADRGYTRKATTYVVSHYLLMYLGYYGLLSTLDVALTRASFGAGQIAVLVIVFSLTNKTSNIPLAPLLDRIPAAYSILLGCLMTGAGFLCLRFFTGITLTVLSLGLAGVGISINALASKQLGAAASDRIENRGRLFSLVAIGVNVAAAVAAPVALFFVNRGQHGLVLLAVAALYWIAGTVTFLNRRIVPVRRTESRTASIQVYLEVLRRPGMRAFLLINACYWFMYGQLYNMFAVYVSGTLRQPGQLGWLDTINALLVVVLQLAVTRVADQLTGGRKLTIVALSYGVFVLTFLAPWLVPGYPGAVVFVVLFTLGEMLFVPSGDVLIVELIDQRRRAIGYSLFAISTALGEASGGGSGVAVYRWLADHGQGQRFWLAAAAVAVLCAALTFWLCRRGDRQVGLPEWPDDRGEPVAPAGQDRMGGAGTGVQELL